MLSLHTSPLAQAGVGDGGGMNVYVRELVSGLAQAGIGRTEYTRSWTDDLPERGAVGPGFAVGDTPAGDPHLPKEPLIGVIDEFTDGVLKDLTTGEGADVVHANYWLSGLAGHRIKHELDLPL